MTERDNVTGLDHTWWRKYETFTGRWTSPDPYNGSMTTADPQSLNRFAYALNDSVNFVDPTGLTNYFHSMSWGSLFDDGYFISANQQGWNLMYGLNPMTISFTYVTYEDDRIHITETFWANLGWEPQKPVPQPAPTPPGLPPHKDPEQPCIDRANDVRRDIRTIAQMLHGTARAFPISQRFPGTTINPRGQSFGTAVGRLQQNGFTLDTVFGFQPPDHPDGENYQKQFGDGLWYHVIVNYPGGASGALIRPDVDPRLQTPRITVHCHATDPSGSDHLWDTVFP